MSSPPIFVGHAVAGVATYKGTGYPSSWVNSFWFCDFQGGWIKAGFTDSTSTNLLAVRVRAAWSKDESLPTHASIRTCSRPPLRLPYTRTLSWMVIWCICLSIPVNSGGTPFFV